MSLWLCRQESVKQPYYINDLDIHVYSSMELSYVIVHNPLFVMEGFVTDELFLFIQEQLGLTFVAIKMAKLKSSGEKEEDILALFLQEAEYCSSGEISHFKQKVLSFRKMDPIDYRKTRADYLMGVGQYTRAVALYDSILALPRDKHLNDSYIAKIYYNRATAYARLFQFEQAVRSYEKSYLFAKDEKVLKALYFLECLEPEIVIGEHCGSQMNSEKRLEWKSEYDEVGALLTEREEQNRLNELFERDGDGSMEGLQEILKGWKKKYRRMQSLA